MCGRRQALLGLSSSPPCPSPSRTYRATPMYLLCFLGILYISSCGTGQAPRVSCLVSQTGVGGCVPPTRENSLIRRIVASSQPLLLGLSSEWGLLCACGRDPLAATAALGSAAAALVDATAGFLNCSWGVVMVGAHLSHSPVPAFRRTPCLARRGWDSSVT